MNFANEYHKTHVKDSTFLVGIALRECQNLLAI